MQDYLLFNTKGFSDYIYWQTQDKKTISRINLLIKTIQRGDVGLGKPEILKGEYKGFCSRRIDEKNRLIYKVSSDKSSKKTLIVSCLEHYPKLNASSEKSKLLKEFHI